MAPTGGAIDISLSFKITTMRLSIAPALFIASKAMPALIAPSPMTATTLLSLPAKSRAAAMPKPADMEVELWPAPNGS